MEHTIEFDPVKDQLGSKHAPDPRKLKSHESSCPFSYHSLIGDRSKDLRVEEVSVSDDPSHGYGSRSFLHSSARVEWISSSELCMDSTGRIQILQDLEVEVAEQPYT